MAGPVRITIEIWHLDLCLASLRRCFFLWKGYRMFHHAGLDWRAAGCVLRAARCSEVPSTSRCWPCFLRTAMHAAPIYLHCIRYCGRVRRTRPGMAAACTRPAQSMAIATAWHGRVARFSRSCLVGLGLTTTIPVCIQYLVASIHIRCTALGRPDPSCLLGAWRRGMGQAWHSGTIYCGRTDDLQCSRLAEQCKLLRSQTGSRAICSARACSNYSLPGAWEAKGTCMQACSDLQCVPPHVK